MPRRSHLYAQPREYLTEGDFPDGVFRDDTPTVVADAAHLARSVRQGLDQRSLTVTRLAEETLVQRSTIYDILGGRTYADTITLARLEEVLQRPLWPSHRPSLRTVSASSTIAQQVRLTGPDRSTLHPPEPHNTDLPRSSEHDDDGLPAGNPAGLPTGDALVPVLVWAPTQSGRTLHLTDDYAGLLETGAADSICVPGRSPVRLVVRAPRPPSPEIQGGGRWLAEVADDVEQRRDAVAEWQTTAGLLTHLADDTGWASDHTVAAKARDWLGWWFDFRAGSEMATFWGTVPPVAPVEDAAVRTLLTRTGGAGIEGLCRRCRFSGGSTDRFRSGGGRR